MIPGGTEYELDKALRKYNRNDYYIVTKLSNQYQHTGDVRKALMKFLDELNIKYVDLYPMHWFIDVIFDYSFYFLGNIYLIHLLDIFLFYYY